MIEVGIRSLFLISFCSVAMFLTFVDIPLTRKNLCVWLVPHSLLECPGARLTLLEPVLETHVCELCI
jgi:hypothetical protein